MTTSNARNGADLLCETLLINDVNMCFANPGTSEMHFVAALDRQPNMKCVLGLSETVVTGAADGYYRMAEKPACTLLHTGPGLANGLANLHNAKRAGSGIVNVVGDHATYHLPFDAPLTSDIDALATPMSNWIGRSVSAEDVGACAATAITKARTAPGGIATMVLPANHAWDATNTNAVKIVAPTTPLPDRALIAAAAAALRTSGVNANNTTILLAGTALRQQALNLASQIAAATGARILAQQANARVQRGIGRVMLDRVPYSVDLALKLFSQTQRVILVGSKAPVGFFAYPGKPSSMLPENCQVVEAAQPQHDLFASLAALAQALGLNIDPERCPAAPGYASEAKLSENQLPTGELHSGSIAQAIVALMPEHSILCDESVSSGREFFSMSFNAAPHDYLQITGGAIGIGIPLATGAALAAPGRKVITMQADGSAMYSLQGLWTQAREQLDVVTVIFSNRRYNILLGELKAVGAGTPGVNAQRMLNLDKPDLDWVKLANGMGVQAARAADAETFNQLLAQAVKQAGPFLIEAMI
jgi:acetolactate synthase I/II/III large subunit